MKWLRSAAGISLLLLLTSTAAAQTTAFTYQGKLTDGGNVANGQYDMQFKLFDTVTVGTGIQQGSTISNSNVQVTSGAFSVTLDFAAVVFDGSPRYLELGVRPAGSPNPYTVLAPRQPINTTPYAIRSMNATAADGLSVACINCVTSSQIASVNGNAVTGTIPVASVPDLTTTYIKNTTTQQTANFNISGNGTIGGSLNVGGTLSFNIVNATTQFNLGGQRILSNAGVQNLFAGISAGASNTSGCCSTFFGFHAGATSNANDNSFFGNNAGAAITSGSRNSFFGSGAGFLNHIGVGNSFFGVSAGQQAVGSNNSFFGDSAGFSNAANGNSFYGASAGFRNTSGGINSFFGINAGSKTDTGSFNSFFGDGAGQTNTSGDSNTTFGALSDVGAAALTNATAIGARALVEQSNSLVLGSINGVNGASASTNVGIGTTIPLARLHVSGGTALFDGNVGIGTQTPNAAKLVVRDDTNIGTAVDGTTSTNGSGVFGESTGASGFGVFGRSTGTSGFALYGDASGGGYAVYANGNAGQARDKGGFAKALIFVNENGTINRCYNSFLVGSAATTAPCGFGVNLFALGAYRINFGFNISDRFFSVVALQDSSFHPTFAFITQIFTVDMIVQIATADSQTFTNAPFMVTVY
jgi:hypothetical protein